MARKDDPWLFRTYAGHTSARESNLLYRTNLDKGQTGLSVAFDLPTQTGYDPDHEMSRGEVGKVGVPIAHLGDMRTLLLGIPLDRMNTSMTINATAMWLLALYVAIADENAAPRTALQGTTQNDILKEYLARGTYIFPPEPSLLLTTETIVWTYRNIPKWNPVNICSYHLQEAGADPILEVAYTLANAVAILDAVKNTSQVDEDEFAGVVGRISFFCNAGIRIIEEMCKMRAFAEMWDRLTLERYGVQDPKMRRFRYGVQVNSLGLTAAQPENNVYRVLLEMLAVTASKHARARSVQLPAWNEALGLPRPWDQQWSLRAQQILALETDLLEYEDLFDGSPVIESKTQEIKDAAWAELNEVLERGGSLASIEYMKEKLVGAHAIRRREIETAVRTVVGVNDLTTTEPSPLVESLDPTTTSFYRVDPAAERGAVDAVLDWRSKRDAAAAKKALDDLRSAAEARKGLMESSINAARAGVTTGEWAGALREVFGEYRAPTGVTKQPAPGQEAEIEGIRLKVRDAARTAGVPRLRLLVAKPGLDGHSNAAEQVALRARDAGFEVIYQGIRLTTHEIAKAAVEEDVHAVGISILSGAHILLVKDLLEQMHEAGVEVGMVPVVVGGVIPDEDARILEELGVARVFTQKDYDLTRAVGDIADLIARARSD